MAFPIAIAAGARRAGSGRGSAAGRQVEAKARFFELFRRRLVGITGRPGGGGPCARFGTGVTGGVRNIGNTRVRPDGVVIPLWHRSGAVQRPNDHGPEGWKPPGNSSRYFVVRIGLPSPTGCNAEHDRAIARQIGKSTSDGCCAHHHSRSQAGFNTPIKHTTRQPAFRRSTQTVQTGPANLPLRQAVSKERAGAVVEISYRQIKDFRITEHA